MVSLCGTGYRFGLMIVDHRAGQNVNRIRREMSIRSNVDNVKIFEEKNEKYESANNESLIEAIKMYVSVRTQPEVMLCSTMHDEPNRSRAKNRPDRIAKARYRWFAFPEP